MKKLNPALLAASVLGALAGFVLTNSVNFGFCQHDQYSCRDVFNSFGDPLMYGMGALALVFLLLLLAPRAWEAWRKFAVWFVPLATVLFIFYPEPGSGDLFSPYPETVFKWASGLYIVVSLFIILLEARKK